MLLSATDYADDDDDVAVVLVVAALPSLIIRQRV